VASLAALIAFVDNYFLGLALENPGRYAKDVERQRIDFGGSREANPEKLQRMLQVGNRDVAPVGRG
jgi:hypothetical protein